MVLCCRPPGSRMTGCRASTAAKPARGFFSRDDPRAIVARPTTTLGKYTENYFNKFSSSSGLWRSDANLETIKARKMTMRLYTQRLLKVLQLVNLANDLFYYPCDNEFIISSNIPIISKPNNTVEVKPIHN